MAELGIARFEDLIGRVDLLEADDAIEHWKAPRDRPLEPAARRPTCRAGTPLRRTRAQDSPLESALDWELIELAEAGDRATATPVEAELRSGTCNRTVGGLLSHAVTVATARGAARRDDPVRAARLGRPVVRRVARARRRADAQRRRERLRRQGPLGRHDRDPAARGRDVRGRGERDRRQHRPLRRDEGQGVLPRPRRRAVRRAELGRGRGRRGRRRPRLRVHDRRPRRRARAHGPQLRGRDERRDRLRPRRGRRLRRALQPRSSSTSRSSTTATSRSSGALVEEHLRAHRLAGRRARARRTGTRRCRGSSR